MRFVRPAVVLGVWFGLMAAIIVTGMIRTLVLTPLFREPWGGIASAAIGAALILTIVHASIREAPALDRSARVVLSATWCSLSLVFASLVARFVAGPQWADGILGFDITVAWFYPTLVIVVVAAPFLCANPRGRIRLSRSRPSSVPRTPVG